MKALTSLLCTLFFIFISNTCLASTYHQHHSKSNDSCDCEHKLVSVYLTPGSLQANIKSIAKQNGWTTVAWESDNDYEWTGKTKITGYNFEDVMRKILINYPLQAAFYKGNKVLAIKPRTIHKPRNIQ